MASRVLGRELRRALRHQRIGLADPGPALLADADTDLAVVGERIRDRARVAHRDRGRAVEVADTERDGRPGELMDRAGHHLAVDLVGLAGLALGQQVAGLELLDRGADGRHDERAREQDGSRESRDETDRALAGRAHSLLSIASALTRSGAMRPTLLKACEGEPINGSET